MNLPEDCVNGAAEKKRFGKISLESHWTINVFWPLCISYKIAIKLERTQRVKRVRPYELTDIVSPPAAPSPIRICLCAHEFFFRNHVAGVSLLMSNFKCIIAWPVKRKQQSFQIAFKMSKQTKNENESNESRQNHTLLSGGNNPECTTVV